jgi:hypothetical protein
MAVVVGSLVWIGLMLLSIDKKLNVKDHSGNTGEDKPCNDFSNELSGVAPLASISGKSDTFSSDGMK